MTDIVRIATDRKIKTTSRIVAQVFGKAHRNVLQSINNLGTPADFNLLNFKQIEFKDDKGRTFTEYEMTRDGFMFLVMGFTGQKATSTKLKFIEAFNAMEAKLLAQQDKLEWKMARLQGKAIRSTLTDTLRDFIEYATGQGSKNAERYYASVTLMEYKALSLIERGAKVGKDFRDTLDGMQIATLTVAENVARKTMQRCMSEGMHYKDIYYAAKAEVEKLADVVRFSGSDDSDGNNGQVNALALKM